MPLAPLLRGAGRLAQSAILKEVERPGLVTKVAQKLPVVRGLFKPESAGAIEGVLVPVQRSLASHGGPVGEMIGNSLRNSRNVAKRTHGIYMERMKPVIESLNPAENQELAQGLLGQPVTSPNVSQLMPGIGKIFSYTGKTPKGILQAIVARGTPIPPDAFADGRRLLNLAFTQHEDELTKTLVKQYAQPLVNRLKRGSYQDMAQKAVNGVLAQSGGGGALGQLRAFNTATLLGRAVMVNATQGTVSAITAGLKPLLQTIKDVGSRQGREEMQNFALRIGESLDGAITDYLRHDLAPGKLQRLGTGVLRRTGFLLTERFNRRFAAAMGRHWFYDLQTKAKLGDVIALRQLKRFGVDPTRAMRGKLTQKDLYDFAQNFVTDTQIRLTPEELPLAANDPASPILSEWWRTVAQFKTFPLKVTELMLRDIETRGAKGIATGAVPGAIAATIGVGVPTAIARRVTAGRAPISKNETWYGLPLEAALSIGSAGLLLDSLEAFERGHELEYIAGPSGGVVQDVGRIVRDIGQGDIRGAVGTAMRRVPTFGPAISKGFMAATKPTPPRRRRRERE